MVGTIAPGGVGADPRVGVGAVAVSGTVVGGSCAPVGSRGWSLHKAFHNAPMLPPYSKASDKLENMVSAIACCGKYAHYSKSSCKALQFCSVAWADVA